MYVRETTSLVTTPSCWVSYWGLFTCLHELMLVAKIEKAAGSVVCYCVWVVETDDDTCVDSLVLRINFNSWAVLH